MRGNQGFRDIGREPTRSIPACAGEPTAASCWPLQWPVYPRVCGGTVLPCAFRYLISGLSPRVRGNPLPSNCVTLILRSIPACAGEPWPLQWPCRPLQVYPRVCGGTALHRIHFWAEPGLSPRVRGNPLDVLGALLLYGSIPRVRGNQYGPAYQTAPFRSIPACAGEPPCFVHSVVET